MAKRERPLSAIERGTLGGTPDASVRKPGPLPGQLCVCLHLLHPPRKMVHLAQHQRSLSCNCPHAVSLVRAPARQRPDVPDAGPCLVRSAASFRTPYRLRRSHGGAALACGARVSSLRAEGRGPAAVVIQYRWALGPRLRQYLLDQGSGRPRLFGRVLLSRRDQRARHGGGPRDDIHVPAPLAQTASLISRLTATKASGLASVPVKKLNRFMGCG